MKKKVLFAASLMLMVLTGCGENGDREGKREGSYNPDVELEGHLITEKPLDLDIHMHFRNMYHYDEEWPVAREAEKMTNIKLHNTASTTGTDSTEMFNMMMISGKLPDIVGGNNRMDDFIRYGMEGVFIPLNDLIDDYAPNIKKFFDENPLVKRAITAPDGNIYFIPYVQDGRVSRGYWIRQDWLDKLGMKQPDTIDDLYNILVAFRDKDPNGNGRADEVPMIFRHWHEMIRMTTLWGARTAGTDTFVSFYKNDDDRVAHGWAEPEFKEGMKHIIKWYNEGLIDPEVFTRGGKTREVLFTANQGGMTRDWMASTARLNHVLDGVVKGFNLQPMLPPVGINGERVEENQRALLKPDGWAVTSGNKYEIETIKYFDFFFSEAGRRLANFGVEGLHYEMVDGKPMYKDEVLSGEKAVNQQMWEAGAQIPIGFKQDMEYEKQWTDEVAQKGVDMYGRDVKYFEEFIAPALTPSERQIYDSKWISIQTYMEESVQRWVLQGADVDKEWDNYIDTLNRLGLEEVTEVLQQAYDRSK